MSAGGRTLKITILGDAGSAEKAMAATAAGASKLDIAIGGIGGGFQKASGAVNAFGAALSGAGIGLALKAVDGIMGALGGLKGSVIDTNAAMESSKQSWAILVGGAEAADKQIQSLFTFAAQTPFEFGEVDKAARLLQTFGGAALNTTENLTLVGDIAAAVDQPFSDVAMWVGRMYDAMQSGKPFGEAAARLQEMGALSGEARTRLEEMQKQGKSGQEIWAAFNGTMGRFSGTMKAQAGTWNGLMSTVQDTLNQLAATAGKPIFAFAQQGLARFAEALSSPKVAAFAELVAGQLTRALDTVGRIIAAAWPPLQRFVGGIFSAGRAVVEAAQAFLAGKTNLGQFIGGLEIMARAILGNIGAALGGLKDAVGGPLGQLGGFIVDFLRGLLPQIAGQLQVWGLRFGDWVLDTAWPVVSAKLAELAAALGEWVTGTALPAIRDQLAAWGTAFGAWVTETAVPFLEEQLPKWQAAIADFLTGTVIPWATDTFKELAERWYGWLLGDALPNLLRALPQWLLAIDVWVLTTALPAWVELMGKFATAAWSWVKDAVPELVKNLPAIANALSAWEAEAIGTVAGAFASLGRAMVDGIIQGLKDAWPRIREELLKLASGLPDPVKGALGISSPSRVFADEVGAPIAEGILAGILSRRPALDRAIGDLVAVPGVGAAGAIRRGVPGLAGPAAESGAVALTVHLHISAPHLTDIGNRADQRHVAQLAGEAARRAWADIVRGGPSGGVR